MKIITESESVRVIVESRWQYLLQSYLRPKTNALSRRPYNATIKRDFTDRTSFTTSCITPFVYKQNVFKVSATLKFTRLLLTSEFSDRFSPVRATAFSFNKMPLKFVGHSASLPAVRYIALFKNEVVINTDGL